MGQTQAAATGVLKWANCHVTNSERDVHRTMKKQGTSLDIKIGDIICDGESLPWISPETWLRFLVDKGLWPTLAGCAKHDWAGAESNWSRFWVDFEKVYPSFGLFNVPDSEWEPGKTAAFCIHGDEGRTLKRQGLLVTSLQSVLGRGYAEKRVPRAAANGPTPLQVNFQGHSFTTRYLLSAIPKTAYENSPEVFHSHLDHVAKSCRKLFEIGYLDRARNERFRIVVVSVKGDAPYLAKAAHFYRSYNTTAKRGEERGPPKGCCPYCLAGTRLCPAEDIQTKKPKWLTTIGVKLPWAREPSLVRNLFHDRSDPSSFFKSDVWHVVHLGIGKSWVASVIQLLLPQIPCSNLEEKWAWLTSEYHGWCKRNSKQAHVSRISPYLMSYGDSSGAMGAWHKGALTCNFLQWLVELIGRVPGDDAGLLVQCRVASYRLNTFFSTLYRANAFLTEHESLFVAEQGLEFLRCYGQMAEHSFRASRQWCFPLYPKLHIYHHICLELLFLGTTVKIAVNPTMWGCQMDEDTIGKASRLSRRVNVRMVARRTLDRYLAGALAAFNKLGLLG